MEFCLKKLDFKKVDFSLSSSNVFKSVAALSLASDHPVGLIIHFPPEVLQRYDCILDDYDFFDSYCSPTDYFM